MPGRWVDGYVVDPLSGRKLRYRLNGLVVLAAGVAAWALACDRGLLAWDAFYVHRYDMLAGACVLGLLFTFAIVLPAPRVPGRSLLADLYLGRFENPQWGDGRVDAKMFLYLFGACDARAQRALVHRPITSCSTPTIRLAGVLLYAALFTFFVVEYLTFEEVHLYTYDFMVERVGFKLGWGCLVFYPAFYCVGLWALAEAPNPHVVGRRISRLRFALLLRVGALARRQPPEVLVQERSAREGFRRPRPASAERRRASTC